MALELKDLTEDERVALVALLKGVVEADGYVTDPEAQQVRKIVQAVGKKAYQAAVEDSDRRFQDLDDLRSFLGTITRQDARELIYATVLDAALADVPVKPEREILDWLARVWSMKVRVVDDAPEK